MVFFNGNNNSELIVGSNDDDTITGGRGDDTILGGGGADSLRGNRGADSIEGGEGVDTLRGGRGNDTLIGDTEGDRIRGGNGDDLLVWNNGDGSDIMRGGRGFDTVQVNGAIDAGDDFELRANGHRAEFERLNLGNFTLDVDNVEQFEINGGGGDDTLNVRDLTGTDVQQVYFSGGEGNDTFDATEANVAVAAYGDGGNDLLKGSSVPEITDTLDGGDGNDTIIGNKGDDLKIGGDGDDRLIWNNGDGSDIMEGDEGYDVTEVNGAVDAGDDFELRANGHRTEFERLNLGNFVLDVDDVEQFEINGLGGDDTLTVQDLTGTDVQQAIFNGADGNDLLDASLTNVSVIANGGAGEDTLLGGSADDTLIGGNGNNTYTGGAGADVFVVSFDGIDVINDFNRGEGDVLEISRSEFGISSIDDLTYDNATGILSVQDTQIATISNDTISPINDDSSSNLVLDSNPVFVPGEDLQLV